LTITGLIGSNKVYDRTTTASFTGTAAYSGLENGESFSVSGTPSATFATVTVGTTKPITVTGYTAPSGNYSVTQPTGLTGNITALALTVTGATVTSKAYDGTAVAAITGSTLVGVISPDVVTIATSQGTFADVNVGTGIAVTAALTLGGTDAGNYSLTQPAGLTGNITLANQTITFGTLAAKVTTDAPFALTGTASSGLTVSYSSSAPGVATVSGSTVTIIGAGTTTITASQAGNGNYAAATPVGQTLTVTVPTVLAWELNAATGSETSVNSTTTATGVNTSALTRGTGLTATALANSFNSANFTVSGSSTDAIANNKYVQFTVNATSGKTVSLSTLDANFRRSSATAPNTFQWQYSLDGFATAGVNIGTVISYTGTGTSGDAQTQINLSGISVLQNVGSSTTVTIRLYGYGAGNIGSTFAIGRLTGDDLVIRGLVATAPSITGAATASAFTMTYGTASADQTFSVSGANLVGSITATAPTGFEVSNGGAYGATTTFAQSGGSASGTLHLRLKATAVVGGNYNSQPVALTSSSAATVNITTASSGNTVSPAPLTITGLAGSNKVYDGLTTASFTGTAAYSGLVNGETPSVSGSPSASFATATVANGKTITVSGYTAPSANYSLTQPTLSADITPATLTYTANAASMAYGGTVPSLSGSVSGFVNSENQAGATTGTLAFTTTAESSSLPGSYAINGSGLSAANYDFVQAAGNTTALTINKASSSTALTSSVNPSLPGTDVEFVATVSSSVGIPTGTVLFKTNSVTLNSTVTLAADGKGTNDTALLPHGTNTVTAEYSGDANYLPSTNGLSQIVNTPPVANTDTYTNIGTLMLKIPIASLTNNDTDADGDTVTFTGLNLTTTNGMTLITNSTYIFYTNSAAAADKFTYTVSDGFGGSATGEVHIVVLTSVTGQMSTPTLSGNSVLLHFAGRPTWPYTVERSTNSLVTWTTIWTTNAPSSGLFDYTDVFEGTPPDSAYYRLRWTP
jgi:hypothetical protein